MNKPVKCGLKSVRTSSKCSRVSSVLRLTQISDFKNVLEGLFRHYFPFCFNNSWWVSVNPGERKVLVIMEMSTITCWIFTPLLSSPHTHTQNDFIWQYIWKEMEIGVFSWAVNVAVKRPLRFALIATVCARLHPRVWVVSLLTCSLYEFLINY